MLTSDLIRKISKLKYGLDLGFFTLYCDFEKSIQLPPENWRSMADLQKDLIYGLERIRFEDHELFVLSVGKIQRHFEQCFPKEKNIPVPLDNYRGEATNLPFNSVSDKGLCCGIHHA